MDKTSEKLTECERKLVDVFYENITRENSGDFKERCLQIIGEALDVSHINLFEYYQDANTARNIFGRFTINGGWQKNDLVDLSINIILWWLRRVKANQVLIYNDTKEIANNNIKSLLEAEGIKSIVVVPQFHKNTFYGFLGIGESRSHRDWQAEEVETLKLAARLIHIVNDYVHTKTLLSKTRELAKEQKMILDCKDIALREILTQMEREKQRIKDDIQANIDQLIIPGLEKLRSGNVTGEQIDILENNLRELTEPAPTKVYSRAKLSPREIEICNMIRNGLSNKEIADNLNITLRTTETHRNNIRKKLKIANQDINLAVYLQSRGQ